MHLDERTHRWVTEELTPITRREGLARSTYMENGRTTLLSGFERDGQIITTIWTHFYECKWFDPGTRACTNYEDRPAICADYPWYDDGPDPNKAIPACCVYRCDLGQEPEPISVTLGGTRASVSGR